MIVSYTQTYQRVTYDLSLDNREKGSDDTGHR